MENMADGLNLNTFINAKQLFQLLEASKIENNPNLIIVDCRFKLNNPNAGFTVYQSEHIPGAIYADLNKDLSSEITEDTGRHPLPKIEEFTKWLVINDFSFDSNIVVYDDMNGGIAARLWFLLKQLGFNHVVVLEGGLQSWLNHPKMYLESSSDQSKSMTKKKNLTTTKFPNSWNDGKYQIIDLIAAESLDEYIIIDSRSPERYLALNEPIDPKKGHIPSSMNLFWNNNFAETGELKDLTLLRTEFTNLISAHEIDKTPVYYCGSGVTACLNLLVAEHLGMKKSAIYIGSWSHWIKKTNEGIVE